MDEARHHFRERPAGLPPGVIIERRTAQRERRIDSRTPPDNATTRQLQHPAPEVPRQPPVVGRDARPVDTVQKVGGNQRRRIVRPGLQH